MNSCSDTYGELWTAWPTTTGRFETVVPQNGLQKKLMNSAMCKTFSSILFIEALLNFTFAFRFPEAQ